MDLSFKFYKKNPYLNISVPPDKTWPVTTTTFSPTLPVDGSTVTVGVPSTVSKTTQSINRTAVYTKSSKDSSGSSREEIEISIYRTVYYLFFIIYKLLLSS